MRNYVPSPVRRQIKPQTIAKKMIPFWSCYIHFSFESSWLDLVRKSCPTTATLQCAGEVKWRILTLKSTRRSGSLTYRPADRLNMSICHGFAWFQLLITIILHLNQVVFLCFKAFPLTHPCRYNSNSHKCTFLLKAILACVIWRFIYLAFLWRLQR